MSNREESMKKKNKIRKSNHILEVRVARSFAVLLFAFFLVLVSEHSVSKRIANIEIGQFKEQKVETFKPVQLSKAQLEQKEALQLKAMLGRLDGFLSDEELKELQQYHHAVLQMVAERERTGDFVSTEKEQEMWEKLSLKLDQYTDFYLQGKPMSYEEVGSGVDYGQHVFDRLKDIMTSEDLDQLMKYREEYLNDDQEASEDIQTGMSDIITKYPQLNQQMILVILLDDKSMENQAVYEINSKLNIEYEDGDQVGLDQISEEEDESFLSHWESIREMVPSEILENFSYFKIGSDGEYGVYAYVMRLDIEGKEWCLNYDPADYVEDGTFPYTIIHEMSHYLSLNEKQVQYYYEDVKGFPTNRYSDQECVANKNSYLQQFYQKFWEDLTPIWNANPDNPKFYERHKNDFVTPYASTSCAEDFAESFAAYVLMKQAPTPETRYKFSFFDSIPELKLMKEEILHRVEEYQILVSPEIN